MFGRNRKNGRAVVAEPAGPTPDEMTMVARVAANYTGNQLPEWGAPCRCPECAEYGMPIRVVSQSADFSCASCRGEWTLSRAAFTAFDQPISVAISEPVVVEVREAATAGPLHFEGGVDRAASAIASAIAGSIRMVAGDDVAPLRSVA